MTDKCSNELSEADIILIGPSRTSKTPTSIFLAYNGLKAANIPYVYNCPFPDFYRKRYRSIGSRTRY
ncbi:kinase/pyrophosphorylase family protein [Rickettsia amblyommatis str. Darkwater]|nr:kinase/pyrophosphorylase family protein [Rickettsia amblyommatis str. Darkwater]